MREMLHIEEKEVVHSNYIFFRSSLLSSSHVKQCFVDKTIVRNEQITSQ